MPARPILSPTVHYQSTSERVTYTADFANCLQADEAIDDVAGADAFGTTLGVSCSSGSILLGAPQILATDTIIDGAEVFAGKAVQFSVRAPAAAEGSYEIKVTVATDYQNTRQLICPLTVQN